MVFKLYVVMTLVCILSGCAVRHSPGKKINALKYNHVVNDNTEKVEVGFQSGEFPYYYWNAPIVQEVAVPAQIAHGVFIPEHKELVLIKPGQWAKEAAYPISTQKERYEKSDHHNLGDVMFDITSIP